MKNGPRDAGAVMAARYWLTEKGEAAVAELRASGVLEPGGGEPS